jgi:hypothetical protein
MTEVHGRVDGMSDACTALMGLIWHHGGVGGMV